MCVLETAKGYLVESPTEEDTSGQPNQPLRFYFRSARGCKATSEGQHPAPRGLQLGLFQLLPPEAATDPGAAHKSPAAGPREYASLLYLLCIIFSGNHTAHGKSVQLGERVDTRPTTHVPNLGSLTV